MPRNVEREGRGRRSRVRADSLAIGVLLLLVIAAAAVVGRLRGEATIHQRESEFGRIRVTERSDGLRALYTGAGRARQTALFPDRLHHLVSGYTRVATVGLALAPGDARILYVGLGGGAMPSFARHVRPDATIEVVEIDPEIVAVAVEYFGFRPDERLSVHVGDGRAFIEQAHPGSYDLIVLDAFADDEIPLALATRQFLEAARDALAPGGIVVSNLWSSNRFYRSMLATYGVVFGEVRVIGVGTGVQRIVVAGTGDRTLHREALVAASRRLAQNAALDFDLPGLVDAGYIETAPTGAPVLEDAIVASGPAGRGASGTLRTTSLPRGNLTTWWPPATARTRARPST